MTDRDLEAPPEDPAVPPGELVLAEEGGVRVFYISAPTRPPEQGWTELHFDYGTVRRPVTA
jgi:hypothetical protein